MKMTDSETSTGIEMTISRKERMEQEKIDYEKRIADPIVGSIGHLGRWQIWMCIIIFMMKFPVAWHQLATVFLAPPVQFQCLEPNGTDKCSTECIEIHYDRTIFKETIITEWDLICDQKYLSNLAQTIFMFGILVGNITFGIWSDKIGRRPPLVFAVIMQLICGIGAAFSPWFWLFCILRFLTAVATGGSMLTSFVLVMEIVGPEKREIMSILYQIPFTIGHLTLPAFSYFLRDWRWYQFAISIPSLIYISYYWLIPESPRWLFTTGQLDKASKVLENGAKFNKMPLDHIRSDLEESKKRKHINTNKLDINNNGSLLDLFRYPNLRIKTIAMCFNWLVCGLAFFGVSQYIGGISGNIFANVAISGFTGIPGTLVAIPMTKYWGRKKTLIASNTLAGICMLVIAFVPETSHLLIVILATIGVFGMTVSFPNVYLYWGELLPTVLRNAGMGIASMVARIGAMIAPQVTEANDIAFWLPPVIFGIIPLIGAMLVFLLPETKGHSLPETIEDGENFGKKLTKQDENHSEDNTRKLKF